MLTEQKYKKSITEQLLEINKNMQKLVNTVKIYLAIVCLTLP